MGTEALRGWFATALLSVLLPGQARAPFTGTLRDESGTPVAGADVVCAFAPDFKASGAADRVTATTDAAGRFVLQLMTGCSYIVWSMGPKQEHGARDVVWPRPEAAAGKTLDLTIDERRQPSQVKVTGVSAWMHDGPVALRLFAGGCCLGPDLMVPGDGSVSLPALPTEQVSVALIDQQGQVIQTVPCDLDGDASVAFAAPRAVAFMAKDRDGKPLAGVRILHPVAPPPADLDRLIESVGQGVQTMRVVAVTGPDGTATGQVGEPELLFGRLAGHGDCWSGWRGSDGILDGSTTRDEVPLSFVLQPTPARTVRVLGLAEGERAEAWFHSSRPGRVINNRGYTTYLLGSAPVVDGVAAVDGAAAGSLLYAHVHLVAGSGLPRCVVCPAWGTDARLHDLDLARLRRLAVTVVDRAGRPVPVLTPGVAAHAGGWAGWLARLVTDGGGHADVLVNDIMDHLIYAVAEHASAFQVVAKGGPAGPMVLRLEPMAVMRLSVTDDDGHPIRGARLRMSSGDIHRPARDAMGMILDDLAAKAVFPSIALWRSNANGGLEVPFLDREGVPLRFKVVAGKRTSGDLALRSADAVQSVVVQ